MKEYSADRIRNVAVVSHQGTGKTSLVEAMLFDSGATTRLGKVEEGNTVSDWDPDEVKHHISINATLAPVDVAGDIPLVALGVLVEAAQVGGVDRIGVLEDGLVLGGDGVALDHGRVPFEYRY